MRRFVLVACFLSLSAPALAGEPETRDASRQALTEAARAGSITKDQLLRARTSRHAPPVQALDPKQRSASSDREASSPSSSASSSVSSPRR